LRFDIETKIVVISTALAACSGAPRRATVVAAAPPQPAAIASATANNAPATAPAETTASAERVDPNLVEAGYLVVRRNDQILYCRTEIVTGQRIGTRICLTAAESVEL
jgi:hypothetical protein